MNEELIKLLSEDEKKAYNALGEQYYCKYAEVRQFPVCKEWEYYELIDFGWADETHGMTAEEKETLVKKAITTYMVDGMLSDLKLYATQWRHTLIENNYYHKNEFSKIIVKLKTMWAKSPYALREAVRQTEYESSERGWIKEKSLDFIYNDGRGKTYRSKYEAEYSMLKALAKAKDFKGMMAALDIYKEWCK